MAARVFVAIIKMRLAIPRGVYQIPQVLSLGFFEKTTLNAARTLEPRPPNWPSDRKQPILIE